MQWKQIFRHTSTYPGKQWATTGKSREIEETRRDYVWHMHLCMGLCVRAWWASGVKPCVKPQPTQTVLNDANVLTEEMLFDSSVIHCCQWLIACTLNKNWLNQILSLPFSSWGFWGNDLTCLHLCFPIYRRTVVWVSEFNVCEWLTRACGSE